MIPEQNQQPLPIQLQGYPMEARTVRKVFTPEELLSFKDEFAELSVKLNEEQIALDEIKAEYKDKMKPMQEQASRVLRCIRTKGEEITLNVYKVDDQEAGMMRYLDSTGEIVDERRLFPHERQTSIPFNR